MTLRQVLDLAHTVWIEEYRRLGMTLSQALDHGKRWAAGSFESEETDEISGYTDDEIARQNDQALAELERMIQGTGMAVGR
jgi:hypothetical protein